MHHGAKNGWGVKERPWRGRDRAIHDRKCVKEHAKRKGIGYKYVINRYRCIQDREYKGRGGEKSMNLRE